MVSQKYQKSKNKSDASHKFKLRPYQTGCLERFQNACYQDAVEFRRAIEQCIPPLRDNGRCVIPHGSEFWTFYHNNRDALHQAHLFVFKQEGCCVGFLQMLVFEKVQRNCVKRDLLWCPKCQSACSSALPYAVAEHLTTDIGLELVTRVESLDGSEGGSPA